MRLGLIMVVAWFALCGTPVDAGSSDDRNAELTRILVTLADKGMSNAARAGPARPVYTRRSSGYLVSVGVKRAARRIADEFQLATLDEWPIISLKVHCLVFGVPRGVDVEQLLADLRARPEVDSAQRLNEFEVSTSGTTDNDDPYAGLQHNLVTLGVGEAHRWSRGDGIEVSVIDTGADFRHPDLRSRVIFHRDFVTHGGGEFTADVHGTAVAGVIAAESNNGEGIVGVAPSTQLSILKACWHRPGRIRAVCDSFTIAKALDHALGANSDIINLSLNGPPDPLLSRMVRTAIDDGIVIVAAAGQDGLGFPVDIPGVIVVGSDQAPGTPTTGSQAMLTAPGADILVPVPDGGYDYASGTSLSAAQVSGIVALLIARQPKLTTDEITGLLTNSRNAGGASVNACRALAELLAETGCVAGDALAQTRAGQNGTERLTTN